MLDVQQQYVEYFLQNVEKEKITEYITIREKDVIFLRFGIGESRKRTLQEIGDLFSVSRQRIRNIEAKALRKIRDYCFKRKFYVEGNDLEVLNANF